MPGLQVFTCTSSHPSGGILNRTIGPIFPAWRDLNPVAHAKNSRSKLELETSSTEKGNPRESGVRKVTGLQGARAP
jgi:hypothetical protein